MPRPFCPRRISATPDVTFFKPAGIPLKDLEVTRLALDELEALRLADRDGLQHTEAAQKMRISRQTFTRIVRAARKKVADFLCEGSALSIEGGPVKTVFSPKDKCCCGPNSKAQEKNQK